MKGNIFVFGVILLSVVTLMQLYVFWRIGSLPYLKSHYPKMLVILAGAGLWLFFALSRFVAHEHTGSFPKVIELIGMNWMAVVFLLFIALLAVEIITVFGILLSTWTPVLRCLALIVGLLLSTVAIVQGLRSPVIQDYEARLSGLPPELDGTVLVGMSDLHLGNLIGKAWLEERISQVEELKPDIIVLLGDIFEGHGQPAEELLTTLRQLSAPMGVWAVPGNHEFYGGNMASSSSMEFDGLHFLKNSWNEVHPGLVVAGVDDLTVNRGSSGDKLLSKALAGHPPGATILLSHSPIKADKAAESGVGLMLSGHTHGGQIWPFGYLVKRFYPLFLGQYEVDGMAIIVCRGTGTWGPRMRLWLPGEIVRVTLHAKGK